MQDPRTLLIVLLAATLSCHLTSLTAQELAAAVTAELILGVLRDRHPSDKE